MRLCCLHDGCNGAVGLSLSHVVLQGAAEDGQLPVGLEEDLVQPLQDAARDARFLMLQAPGQVPYYLKGKARSRDAQMASVSGCFRLVIVCRDRVTPE